MLTTQNPDSADLGISCQSLQNNALLRVESWIWVRYTQRVRFTSRSAGLGPQERQHFFLRFLAFDGQNNVAPLRDEIQELVGACIVPPRHFLADQPVASALPNDLSNRGLKREAARQQRIDHRLRRFRIGLICHLFAGCLLQQPKIAPPSPEKQPSPPMPESRKQRRRFVIFGPRWADRTSQA